MLEYTAEHVKAFIQPDGSLDLHRLASLPTLVMPETGFVDETQVARVGRLTNLRWQGRELRFNLVDTPGISSIGTERIEALADELDIQQFEFHRTHWAVKEGDLYAALFGGGATGQLAPKVFNFPVQLPVERDLVAVMMPFAGFDSVDVSIKEAVESLGLRCHRADDIWENHHIMDDVISLIWRSRVVVSDLSGKNPNVFYETGIAHALGRDVVQLAQSLADVPFDLRSIRTLTYLNNGEGLSKMKTALAQRLESLVG
ncbi:hypothetical protein NQ152_10080 [Microbacterium sp. zg.B48]|uniref:hypothetical protein n=1 Tax=Microbacterium sp. zg.B48 TaxID=2969408 RepID=UPI00214C05C1|nr:hypothetical protein [Microbacterium sp. zg.B48]MCR2763854.1 hypothetical protein [Microbacterium sp. zg.B48]